MISKEKPHLLFLPGLLNDARLWYEQIKALKHSAHCEVADLTKSDTMAGLADNVIEAHFKKNTHNYALIGMSMGGYTALELMRRIPARISKLVLLNTSARPDSPEQREVRKGLIELSEHGNFKGVTPRLLPRLIYQKRLHDTELTIIIKDMAQDIGKDAFIRQQKAIMSRIDSRPHLPQITAPTLVIAGENDLLTPVEVMDEIASSISLAKIEIIEECGHLSPLERPAQVVNHLETFLL